MAVVTRLATNALVTKVVDADTGKEHLVAVSGIQGGWKVTVFKKKGLLLAIGVHVLTERSLAVLVLEIVTENLFHQAISVFWAVY